MENKKILIADDEERIVRLVKDFLNNAGYEVICAYDGQSALDVFHSDENISLAIIDIMMPNLNGWEVTRSIRDEGFTTPIIMLSARSEDFDMLEGFDAGIDEYVTKPFSPAVLVKRVDAILKRADGNVGKKDIKAGLLMDEQAYMAYLDGAPIEFTQTEFEMLLHLYDNKGRVLSREQLIEAVWGYDFEGDTRVVDGHIARIRYKLGEYGNTHLKTVYGMGYKLNV